MGESSAFDNLINVLIVTLCGRLIAVRIVADDSPVISVKSR